MTTIDPHFEILAAVKAGAPVSERDFDLIYPKAARKFSRAQWTPLAAAIRSTALLVDRPDRRVLDVGAGIGKLCLVGALTTMGHFTGCEQDPDLVNLGKTVFATFKVPRVKLLCGDALALDWSAYDSLYFFNPFGESRNSGTTFAETIDRVTVKLAALGPGTRVVTYHGFGGQMPPQYRQEVAEVVGPGVLQLWVKV